MVRWSGPRAAPSHTIPSAAKAPMSNNLLESAEALKPPPAPPLPPQPFSARAADAIARIAQPLIYGSRSANTVENLSRASRSSRVSAQRSPRSGEYPLLLPKKTFNTPSQSDKVYKGFQNDTADDICSSISSRTTAHRTGISIAAFDISPSRTHAILAGRDILKTVQVSESACTEDFNLRAAIIAYAATHETSGGGISAKHKDQLAASDVKWSHGVYDTTIATAAANGQIVVYDLNRAGVELARLHEHNRQVHRLGFNPHSGNLMLSGSQDGTIRLWDLRALARNKSVLTCQSKSRFVGNSEGVRDLKWSPANGVEFAAGTDNGVVQRWDFRKENAPLLKINAHDKTCNAIDWHPDGKHLVSGGIDKTVKVWDFSSSDRRMKASWLLHTPHAVLNVCWRPACWTSEDRRPGEWHCTQLATSYDKGDPQIHIWDLRRPCVPFRVLDRYDMPPTAILWHSESLLWFVGSAGVFTQADVELAPKTVDHRSPNTLDIASDGQIISASMKMVRRPTSIEDVTNDVRQSNRRGSNAHSKLSNSHSITEGSLEEPSLLNSSFKNRRNKASVSLRSIKSVAGTPPSSGPVGQVFPLDQTMLDGSFYKHSQVIGIGYVPGLFDADAFKFMARHYKAPPALPAPILGYNLHQIFFETFAHNSEVAAYAGQHRLAQTWNILGLAVKKEFKKRAEHSYQQRVSAASAVQAKRSSVVEPASKDAQSVGENQNENVPTLGRGQPGLGVIPPRTLDDASSVTTPLVRPVPDVTIISEVPSAIAAVNSPAALQLPQSAWGKQTVKPVTGVSQLAKMTNTEPLSGTKQVLQDHLSQTSASPNSRSPGSSNVHQQPLVTTFGDVDRQMAERRAAMGNYRAQPRPVLRLDEPIQMSEPSLGVPNLDRHDSNESFQLFSASTDSSHKARSTTGSYESNGLSDISGSISENPNTTRATEGNVDSHQIEKAVAFDEEADSLTKLSPSDSTTSGPASAKELRGKLPAKFFSSIASYRPTKPTPPIVNTNDFQPYTQVDPPEDEPSEEQHEYIESDFLPVHPTRGNSTAPPWTATAMIIPLVEFYTREVFDSQFPAYLLLHLAPYLHVPMSPARAEELILGYHMRLQSLQLYVQAAALRNHAHKVYPRVASYGHLGIVPGEAWTNGPWCTNCKASNEGNRPKFCERCDQRWAECAICEGYGPISPDRSVGIDTIGRPATKYPKAGDALWGWCQVCSHGGHMGCLKVLWHDPASEGACPTVGCLCDCMAGRRRDEIYKKMEDDDIERKPRFVPRDEWSVGESAAVSRARGMVAGEAGRSILQGGRGLGRPDGAGPLTLGATGRSGSGGKKVRIVVPDVGKDEDVRGDGGKGEGGNTSVSAP